MRNLPLVVVDSSCFLAYLLDEDRGENRADRATYLFAGHNRDHIVIMPAIARLETFGKVQKGPNGADGNNRERMESNLAAARNWLDNAEFLIGMFDDVVADRAIDLMPEFGLKGMDASILALAMIHGATKLYTFDRDLLRVGVSVPGLSVEWPPMPSQPTLIP
ncbi:type II toxin-antitoxin system VapC family toxin [Gulosibacter chungangensis]|uniref:type II toxin-antitoxin system VapC family toxin n=1 Tax=Gulosibacter chungangensis TaxID=979746 RepID=UPI001788378A|nr:type II toxin-antitoxin system VapC family toxin [Gulosibacter chungangensis]